MASVEDRWHSYRPTRENAEICREHTEKGRVLYRSSLHGRGRRYAVRYWDSSNKQRRKSFTLKGDADRYARKIATDIDRGDYIDPKASRTPLREVCELWLDAADHRDPTAEGAAAQLKNHVYPYLGDRAIGSLKRSDIQKWIKERRKVLAESTLRITIGRLRAVLTFAVNERIIAWNPSNGIRLPPVTKKQVVPLHRDAVAALVAEAPPPFQTAILVAAGTGLRAGELFGLEEAHLDLEGGYVRVAQQLITPSAGQPYIGRLKTRESYRVVPLARSVVEALREHLRRFPAAEVKIEDRSDPRNIHTRVARLVFPTREGNPMRKGNWSKIFSTAVSRANTRLETEGSTVTLPEGTTTHTLRHTYASLLIHHRESIKTVQKRLGHSKPSITLDVYVHLFAEVPDTTADAVEEALGDIALAA